MVKERGKGSNIQALVLTVIIAVVVIVITIIVLMMVEFGGGSWCARCLRTYSRREHYQEISRRFSSTRTTSAASTLT